MHWVMVGEYPLPKQFGGDVALEFCNTRAAWRQPIRPEFEWLKDYDRFAVWAQYQSLTTTARTEALRAAALAEPEEAATVLAAARRLREALYPVLLGSDTGEFAEVAAAAERAAAAAVFERPDGSAASWRLPDGLGLELPLLLVAQAAAALLSSPDAALVRACPGQECGWLFLDRRGRRRWCSMGVCGNKAKARSFAQRHATQQ